MKADFEVQNSKKRAVGAKKAQNLRLFFNGYYSF
jgi:hypothetical protein